MRSCLSSDRLTCCKGYRPGAGAGLETAKILQTPTQQPLAECLARPCIRKDTDGKAMVRNQVERRDGDVRKVATVADEVGAVLLTEMPWHPDPGQGRPRGRNRRLCAQSEFVAEDIFTRGGAVQLKVGPGHHVGDRREEASLRELGTPLGVWPGSKPPSAVPWPRATSRPTTSHGKK